jgi:hypothetical protein
MHPGATGTRGRDRRAPGRGQVDWLPGRGLQCRLRRLGEPHPLAFGLTIRRKPSSPGPACRQPSAVGHLQLIPRVIRLSRVSYFWLQ